MRPTIRGWTVLVVAAGAVAMAWHSGPRALNAVVVPLGLVLVAGLIAVVRTGRPTVRRHAVDEGFIGDVRTVTAELETDATAAATVRDTVGDGLAAVDEPVAELTLDGEETVRYDVRLEARGERTVGPLSIAVRDVFGLVERRFAYAETTPVLVYPYVHELRSGSARDLEALAGVAERADRGEFDHLREYRRGDPLRDVHWKSVAKRPEDELVVTEYAPDEDAGTATVAGECTPGREDELATAVASVATYLLECEASVGVTVPDGTRQPGSGRRHHRELLGLLAVPGHGELEDRTREDADVLVRADANGTTIAIDGREMPFERLRDGLGGTTPIGRRTSDRSDRDDAEGPSEATP